VVEAVSGGGVEEELVVVRRAVQSVETDGRLAVTRRRLRQRRSQLGADRLTD